MIIKKTLPKIVDLPKPEVELLSLSEYTNLANKYIKFYCIYRRKNPNNHIINSEDCVSHVIEAIIISDHYWNPNKKSRRQTYHIKAVIWTIDKLLRSSKSKKYKLEQNFIRLNAELKNELNFELGSSEDIPDLECLKNEIIDYIKDCIENLSEQDRSILLSYFVEDKTLESIGKELCMSRQGIQQRITNIILPNLRKQLKLRGINEYT